MKLSFFHHLQKQEEIILSYNGYEEPSEMTSWVKDVHFSICFKRTRQKIGECDLRLGMNEEIYYAGQVGYRIYLPYRGHGYAYEACRLLFSVAKNNYEMKELLITCSPENVASCKTLERLNGKYIEKVDVPENHWLYARGETIKLIYRFIL